LEFFKFFSIGLLCISEGVILFFAFLSRKPIKTLLLNAFLGIGALCILKLIENFSGIFIPINQYTVLLGGTMGLPSVVAILILRLIFI